MLLPNTSVIKWWRGEVQWKSRGVLLGFQEERPLEQSLVEEKKVVATVFDEWGAFQIKEFMRSANVISVD